MAWPGIPNAASSAAVALSHPSPSMDMKMYEMMEHLRTVQIVQAEQSRRLDDQAYRLHQLEVRENSHTAQVNRERLESQRYLWGPGPVGSVLGTSTLGTPAIGMGIGSGGGTNGVSGRGFGGLPGLGFEVFATSPQVKNDEREIEIQGAPEALHELNGHSETVNGSGMSPQRLVLTADGINGQNTIETDIDNLLHSPTFTAKDPSSLGDNQVAEPVSRATSRSPAAALPTPTNGNSNTNGNPVNYFPYVLAIQCYLGKHHDRSPTSWDSDILTAQINTSVHASFIDSALVHHLGISHKIRNRRPTRYQMRFSTPRPRILLPVYFPSDLTSAATSPTSPNSPAPASIRGDTSGESVAKVFIDFVVVSIAEIPAQDHRLYTQIEIGSQALFLHGIDVLFSSRSIRVGSLHIPLPQIAPRDQKRLLSSVALATQAPQGHSPAHAATHSGHSPVAGNWERIRRPQRDHEPIPKEDAWGEDTSTANLLRDTSTNSSFSSMSTCVPGGGSTTNVTSPSMTEVDPNGYGACRDDKGTAEGDVGLSPQTATFGGALQFIPSSVVGVGKHTSGNGVARGEESRSRNSTLQQFENGTTVSSPSTLKGVALDRSQSQGSHKTNGIQEDNHSRRGTQESLPPLPHLTPVRNNSNHNLNNTKNNIDQQQTSIISEDQTLETTLLSPSIPSRTSSLATADPTPTPTRSSSLVDPEQLPPLMDSDLPRLPSTLLDKVVQRKASATWPRSLGKKVAPWTSQDATKTSILGNGFEEQASPPAPRKMKVLKPVRSGNVHVVNAVGSGAGGNGVSGAVGGNGNGNGSSGGGVWANGGANGGEVSSKSDSIAKDEAKDSIIKAEVKERDISATEEKTVGSKNVGGGAFHWMK